MALAPINNGDGGAETRYKMNQIIDAFGAVDADVLADMQAAQAATELVYDELVAAGFPGGEYEGWMQLLLNTAGETQFGIDDLGRIHGSLADYGRVKYADGSYFNMAEDYEDWHYLILDNAGYIQFGISTTSGVVLPLTTEVATARGAMSSLDSRLNNALTSRGYRNTYMAAPERMRKWQQIRAQIKCGESARYILNVFGDSWVDRDGPGWVRPFNYIMQAAFGDGGPGWVSAGRLSYPANTAAGIVTTSGTVVQNTTFDGRGPDMAELKLNSVNATASFPVTATSLSSALFLYCRTSGGGTFQYSVDGGATYNGTDISTDNASDALGSLLINSGSTPALPSGTFTLVIKCTATGSAGVTIFGTQFLKATGFVVNRLAYSGSQTTQWAATSDVRDAAISALGANGHAIQFGTNDQGIAMPAATFQANLVNLIGRLRGITNNVDIAIVGVPENVAARATPMTTYRDAGYQVAFENDCAWLDLYKFWGESIAIYGTGTSLAFITSADTIHPQTAGYRAIAQAYDNLMQSR